MFNVKVDKDLFYLVVLLIGSLSYLLYLSTGSFIFLSLFFITGLCLYLKITDLFVNNKVLVFGFFSFLVFLVFGSFSPNFDFQKLILSLLYIIVCIGYAINLSLNKYNLICVKIIFWGFVVFLLFNFLKMGLLSFEEFNNIFHSSSRNVVSAVIIFLLLNLMLVSYQNKEDLGFIYFIITLLFCVLLYGRTGIIISFILLIYKLASSIKNIFYLILMVIFFVVFIFYLDYLLQFLEENTNLSRGLESPRSLIFSEYFDATIANDKNILFGSSIAQCCQYAILFDQNLHNSFLYAHSRFGLVSIFYIIICTVFIIFTKRFLIIFTYFVILFRYFYDQLGFFGIFDITFYILIILCCLQYGLLKKRGKF